MTSVEKLVSISSPPLAGQPLVASSVLEKFRLGHEVRGMLELKNGFYTFESALHVFPDSDDSSTGMTLQKWNSDSLWRQEYPNRGIELLFFAEDLFQDQFCLPKMGILRFQAETNMTAFMADSIESWAAQVLQNYPVETGWPVANKWQLENGPLAPGKRLMPKTPFFLGGDYSTENLWAGDAVEGMRFKADLAMQTRNLPDGAQVRIVIDKKAAD